MKTKLDGVTFTAGGVGVPHLWYGVDSRLVDPGETIEVVYVANNRYKDLVVGCASIDHAHTYEFAVAQLLSYGVFFGAESSELLTKEIEDFRWRHPKLCLRVNIDLLMVRDQDPRFDIRWWSEVSGFNHWTLYPLPHPPCPQTDREIASVIYHEGYQEYQLLDVQGEVLETYPSSPLREPPEVDDCVTTPTKAITELWNRREALYAEWRRLKVLPTK